MKIGQLFINLGIQGAEKAVGALGGVRKGLADVTSLSTEAKVGILGVFYGLERLTSESNRVGLGLQNFEKLTGLSSDALQRWQFLMRQGGVSAEETTQNVQSLQKALAQIALNKGAPQGITALANVLGGIDHKKLQDPFYFLDRMREYARVVKEKGGGAPVEAVMNDILGSFSLSPGFIAQLKTSQVDLQKVRPSELYSSKEQTALARMSVQWSNLGNQIEKSVGRLNVQFGPRLLADIQKLVPQVLELVKAFGQLVDKLKVMQGIAKVFQGWTMIFKELTALVQQVEKGGLAAASPLSLDQLKFLAKDATEQVRSVVNNVQVDTTVQVGGSADPAAVAQEVVRAQADAANKALRQIPQPGY